MTDDEELDAMFRTHWIHYDDPDVSRERQEIVRLPDSIRWDLVRRNPDYIRGWQLAASETCSDDQLEAQRAAKREILSLYFAGKPVDPRTPFEQLPTDPSPFERDSNVVHPISVRAILAWMLSSLDYEEVRTIIEVLRTMPPGHAPWELTAPDLALPVQWAEGEVLEKTLPKACIALDSFASLDSVIQSVRELHAELSTRKLLPDIRERAERIPSYLKVWDAREGWNDGTYDKSTELSFSQIAENLGRSESTVTDQYHRVYSLITRDPGRAPAPGWMDDIKQQTAGPPSRNQPSTNVIDFTALNSKREWFEPVAGGTEGSEADLEAMKIAVFRLFQQGLGDDEILGQMTAEPDAEARQTIADLRVRFNAGEYDNLA